MKRREGNFFKVGFETHAGKAVLIILRDLKGRSREKRIKLCVYSTEMLEVKKHDN